MHTLIYSGMASTGRICMSACKRVVCKYSDSFITNMWDEFSFKLLLSTLPISAFAIFRSNVMRKHSDVLKLEVRLKNDVIHHFALYKGIPTSWPVTSAQRYGYPGVVRSIVQLTACAGLFALSSSWNKIYGIKGKQAKHFFFSPSPFPPPTLSLYKK